MPNRRTGTHRLHPKDFGLKGVNRTVREWKRMEAQNRNAVTPHDRTRQHRERCDVDTCEVKYAEYDCHRIAVEFSNGTYA